jgi:hypothetical protein
MRLKRSNLGVCVSALVSLAVLSATAPAPALALPEGRVYEMVSPPYKGGYGAKGIEAVAPDGESVAFFSPGAFAGAPSGASFLDYVARRGTGGWVTTPSMVPAGLAPYVVAWDVSRSLDTILALGKPGGNEEGVYQQGTEEGFLLHSTGLPDVSANWELAGGMWLKTTPEEELVLGYMGASADLCHLLVTDHNFATAPVLPEAAKVQSPVYELSRGCDGEPVALRLLGVKNKNGPNGEPEAIGSHGAELGIESYDGSNRASSFNAVAAGGREIFFTSGVPNHEGDHQLFVRLGGARTVEVSRPLSEKCAEEIPCTGAGERARAAFMGASEDGSKVFFTSTLATSAKPLVPGDTDVSNNLYMARIGCPEGAPSCEVSERVVTSLVQVSHDPNGGEAGVQQSVVRLAPDGSRAYFVATGDLLGAAQRTALEGEGRPVPHVGADNLYVYEPDPEREGQFKTVFIADLCSGFELSGAVQDARCPSRTGTDASLWVDALGEAQTAGADGRFLVFATYAQLTSSDTDAARDVYRYDAATGALERVSGGEAGADANGNDSSFDANIAPGHWGLEGVRFQYEMNSRAVSEDGSRIVFTSAEPLSPAAINGLSNVYEWHKEPGWSEGVVSMVSSGSGSEPVTDTVISPDGRDVFFVTAVGLVAQDTDGAPDVYDARLEAPGEGFPAVAAERQPCSGDACPGPLTNPAPLLVPGSVSQAAGQNFAASAPATTVKPKGRAAPRCRKGFTKKHNKCVKSKTSKKAKRAASNRRVKRVCRLTPMQSTGCRRSVLR